MFFDGSFLFYTILLTSIYGTFLQNKNAIQLVVSEEKIFKGFFLWLPWQPEFFMEHNYLKEFERNIPVKFGKNPANSF